MPTRFKYTKVHPQSFALNPAEILMATDAELNQYMGLRKYAPYRKDGSNWDKNRATRLGELKQKIGDRSKALGADDDVSKIFPEKPTKKRKGKKERMREKAGVAQEVNVDEDPDSTPQPDVNGPLTSSSGKRKATEDAPVSEDTTNKESVKRKRRRHKKITTET